MGRMMAEILERIASFQVKEQQFDEVMRPVRDDFLLPGRGSARVYYKADIAPVEVESEYGDEGGEQQYAEEVSNEVVPAKHIYWKDFGHTPARSWDDVEEIWFTTYLDKDSFVERFGDEKLEGVEFNEHDSSYEESYIGSDGSKYSVRNKCKVIELWCKRNRKVYWFSPSVGDDFLDVKDDPLHLKEFFPTPRPLFSTLTSDSLVPIPSVSQYMNATIDLDETLSRRREILRAIKVTGVFDKAFPQLANILGGDTDLKLFPVDNWVQFKQSGGMNGSVELIQIDQYIKAFNVLTEAAAQQKALIDEMSGVSDILRGSADPRETATAQQIKGRFATLRLEDAQREVQRYARDLIALMTEVAVEHLDDQTIAGMVNAQDFTPQEQEMFPQALQMLRDDKQRRYRINIETDSTISVDQEQDKASRMEAVQGFTQLLEKLMPMAAQSPPMMPAILELITFGMRAFPNGRRLEFSFEQAFEGFAQQAQQQQQNQPPPPEAIKAQAEAEARQAEMQFKQQESQFRQQEAQVQMQFEAEKSRADLALRREEMVAELEMQRQKMMADIQLEREKASAKIQQDYQASQARTELQAKEAASRAFSRPDGAR